MTMIKKNLLFIALLSIFSVLYANAEATQLWSCKGTAWDPDGNELGDITVMAYSDNTYAITDWMGNEGYDLKFKMVKDATWTGLLSIQNQYATEGSYDFVNAGSQKKKDAICYVGLYTMNGYSAVYSADYTTRVEAPQQEGGYLNIYAYAYDSSNEVVFDGYYAVTWSQEKAVKGDVNGDDSVDISDVNAIISVICGGEPNSRADVNNDGATDISDVNAVIGIICGG